MRIFSALLLFCTLLAHSQIKQQLQGSWELKAYVDHPNNGTEWESYGRNILYQKHISGDYFTWIKYDKDTDELLGMGGGAFYIDSQGRYVENLDFFYPPGSNELGQAIPFTVEFDGKDWIHTGYARVMDIGSEGEAITVDSTKIEEAWQPIRPGRNDDALVGAWELQRYQEEPNSGYMEYPDFIGYMKIITETHFAWIKWDSEGDQIYAAGSGTYSYREGRDYIENLEMHYPPTYTIGQSIEFSCMLNGNTWKHSGDVQNQDGTVDVVDEFWSPKILEQDFSDLDLD